MNFKKILFFFIIIFFVLLILLPRIFRTPHNNRYRESKINLTFSSLSTALRIYKNDWNDFPPHDVNRSSFPLICYLDGNINNGGPSKKYYDFNLITIQKKFLDPYGNEYHYENFKDVYYYPSFKIWSEGDISHQDGFYYAEDDIIYIWPE